MFGVFAEALANFLVLLAGFGGGMYLICEVTTEATGRAKALAWVGGLFAIGAGYAWTVAMAVEYL